MPHGVGAITDRQGQPACLFPTNTPPITVTPAGNLKGLTTDGTLNGPPNLDRYFYDSSTGMLYFWIAQADRNAEGPSPLGNCTGADSDPDFCPQNTNGISTGESYYNCPAEGCPIYRVTLNDASYSPGPSTCPVFGSTGDPAGWATGTGGATWPGGPADEPYLVDAGGTVPVERTSPSSTLPHYAPGTAPSCASTQ